MHQSKIICLKTYNFSNFSHILQLNAENRRYTFNILEKN